MNESAKRKKRKRSKDKGAPRQWVEYVLLVSLLGAVRALPYGVCRAVAAAAGEAIFRLVPRRRRIARANLRIAFPELGEAERLALARRSCRSFVLTGLEGAKFLARFDPRRAREMMLETVEGGEEVLKKARAAHEDAGGCVFVAPHLGNWEFLAHAGALAGIPLTIPVRPLDNRKLEAALRGMRAASGQEILSKRNAFFHLREALRKGRSVAILADQNAGAHGIDAPFFGRKASTTPAPAALAVLYKRPILLVSCLRREGASRRYEAFLSEPIAPDMGARSAKEEIARLTAALNEETESLIRKGPEQYLWMHDRWKLAKGGGRARRAGLRFGRRRGG